MVRSLEGFWGAPRVNLPDELELRPWREEDLNPAGQLIACLLYTSQSAFNT